MPPSEPHPLALIASVPLETGPLAAQLRSIRHESVGRKEALAGLLEGRPVILMAGGMGKTNAAHALTALLESRPLCGVVGFGVGGAYPGSGLEVSDVALASSCIYGDEGVDAPAGWISTEGIGIPLLEAGGKRRFNTFPLPAERVAAARAALEKEGIRVRTGPFMTLSACSGTTARGEELRARFGAVCEGMEGAALAHVAALYGVPFLEIRGISNRVEDRDLSAWRLREAASAAAAAVRVVAREWRD